MTDDSSHAWARCAQDAFNESNSQSHIYLSVRIIQIYIFCLRPVIAVKSIPALKARKIFSYFSTCKSSECQKVAAQFYT